METLQAAVQESGEKALPSLTRVCEACGPDTESRIDAELAESRRPASACRSMVPFPPLVSAHCRISRGPQVCSQTHKFLRPPHPSRPLPRVLGFYPLPTTLKTWRFN